MVDKLVDVSVIGLGRLGYPIAACIAAKGHEVIGVDINPRTVELIGSGRYSLQEPGLEDLLHKTEGRFKASSDTKDAVLNSEVTLVVVPTPSGADGAFSVEYVLESAEAIASGLAAKSDYHLVVIVSTVMPGSTEREIKHKLEEASGRKCGVDFGLCYAPAFVALGSVIRDFLQPDYLLIGESDARAGDQLKELYSRVCDNDPPMSRMNFVNAELTKLATNAFVSTKITFGNMIAQVCENLPGAHVDVVTLTLGLDSRIGVKYLKGGTGYGGPCLVRDNVALSALASRTGGKARLAEATHLSNQQEVDRLARVIKNKLVQDGMVGILGLSYKPGTDVVDSSQGVLLSQALVADGIPVVVYDPAAMDQAKLVLGESVGYTDSAKCCVAQSELVVITTPWNEFESLKPKDFGAIGSRVLIDCWRVLEGSSISKVTDYIPLGVGPHHKE